MIDKPTFKRAWALLCERFNREPSDVMTQMYYRTLSARMSTEEFQHAAQRIFNEREFWPKPADFYTEADRGDPEATALEQWEVVHSIMRGFGGEERLTAEGKRVVAMLGGERKLRNTKLDEVQFVRRDFLKLYGDAQAIAQRETRPLIQANEEGQAITAAAMAGPDKVLELAEARKRKEQANG